MYRRSTQTSKFAAGATSDPPLNRKNVVCEESCFPMRVKSKRGPAPGVAERGSDSWTLLGISCDACAIERTMIMHVEAARPRGPAMLATISQAEDFTWPHNGFNGNFPPRAAFHECSRI